MTAKRTSAIGRRIAAIRKVRAIATTADLAARIPNPKITQSVIQNIESGRKADISVGQLLDIAMGLGVSPLFLLIEVDSPGSFVDLDNVGADVSSLTMDQFDQWLAMPRVTAGGVTPPVEALQNGAAPTDQILRGPLSAVRELRSSLRTREQILRSLGRDQEEPISTERSLRINGNLERLKQVDIEIDQWRGLAERWGVDLTNFLD